MHPYYSIINESKYDENAGFHYFLFPWSHDTYVAVEYYCTNPECDCTSVILHIDRVTPSGTTENIGYLSIGISDFRVEEIKVKHKAVYQSKLNKEFKQGIPEEWRPSILKHRNHVRELIGVRFPTDSLQESKGALLTTSILPSRSYEPMSETSIDLDKNSTMGYVEIFGESADQLIFTHGKNTILVDEQYCMNPSCDCRQGLLTFIQLEAGKSISKFVIGYSTHKRSYTVIENYTTKKELEDHVVAFENAYPAARLIVSKHYDDMKREGKRAMVEKQQSVAARSAMLPGRNDPCSCGSGKKYKKCCGAAGG
ncbi:YecA family protein [Paenibacillus sp. BR2-3]|uniref:YecA family protein n=1 Tax=Paenibacillus sp. BR2-3 TaxID=3048494 RepID=UPI003977D35E